MTEIRGFRGRHAFLSNFEPAVIRVRGMRYPTVEHAFQACKTEDPAERAVIAALPTPAEARRAGQRLTLRPGWEDLKEEVMLAMLRVKFRQPDLRERLLATGDAALVEENAWRDRFWGVYRGHGLNRLGVLLMQVREEILAVQLQAA
ncbi:NADAR family protein [Deinococcus sp. YIM 134068]|uniref:NADAR family protein n=1 Tax=Deinococcus lichenicola TaxID=3118910 RepID=UPI002F95282A